jgi:bacteriorhodopsin
MNDIKNENNNNLNSTYSSFYITYVFLMTTATITFIEAIRTNIPEIRNILNLETCISVVAAFFYAKFVKMIEDKKTNNKITYKEINDMRYLDWSITTPIMLLVLVLALLYNNKMGSMNFFYFIIILLLNYGMLASGFLGENKTVDKVSANVIGFIFFIALYLFIYYIYVRPKYNFDNNILYFSFVFLWAIYGIVYFFDDKEKNIGYNILDLFAKCFVGIFFWAYYAKVFTL